jgi:hypothetical protein
MSENNKDKEPLALDVIMAAIDGDEGALRVVVKHYEEYITALSMKRLFDEGGEQYLFVDEDMRRELEMRLIIRVLTFKPKKPTAA